MSAAPIQENPQQSDRYEKQILPSYGNPVPFYGNPAPMNQNMMRPQGPMNMIPQSPMNQYMMRHQHPHRPYCGPRSCLYGTLGFFVFPPLVLAPFLCPCDTM